jgi:hypothetical protein
MKERLNDIIENEMTNTKVENKNITNKEEEDFDTMMNQEFKNNFSNKENNEPEYIPNDNMESDYISDEEYETYLNQNSYENEVLKTNLKFNWL